MEAIVASPKTLPSPAELAGRWVAALEEAGLRPRILEVAGRYPEERSISVGFPALEAADLQLADLLLERPEEVIEAGRRALRELIPAPGPEVEGLRLRVTELPPTVRRTIRGIREGDLGRFVSLESIVRKATEVRPQIQDAVFLCLACKNEVHEPQEGWSPVFHEPLECSHCGKPAGRTRFRLLPERSTYIDSQRIEIQENPEHLKGGAHPQGLTVLLTEDLSGKVIPGNRIVINGVLKGLQRASASRGGVLRSTTFDLLLLGNSIEFQQREYDEIPITEEEQKLILTFREDPKVLDRIVLSLAPTIKGMEEEKVAIALQLFGGVEKRHADGIRVRGDIHCLLVGDPGCLIGDERVLLGDGTLSRLDALGTHHLQPIATPVRLGGPEGGIATARRFHRYRRQKTVEVVTETGKSIRGTYNHPLLRWDPVAKRESWCRLDQLRVGDRLRVVREAPCVRGALAASGFPEPEDGDPRLRTPRFVDADLAAILAWTGARGTITASGVRLDLRSAEPGIEVALAQRIGRVFGVRPGRRPRRSRSLQVDSPTFAAWMRGAEDERVPSSVFLSPDRVVASYLRWRFEARGSCAPLPGGGGAIRLRADDPEALRDVQTLLLRWGIESRILGVPSGRGSRTHSRPRNRSRPTLRIEAPAAVRRFARAIGFVSRGRNARLREARRPAPPPPDREDGPPSERIVAVRRRPVATVYDIEVPGPQRFVANGIISHNTAKSQLLRYIADVAPRGVYTSGKGATAAGLTAAAVKDDFAGGRWVLEAGMLVLADGGIAVIDELDKMSPEDRSAMHEALEQQTVSIAKAGITATLNARCPVLAAANPKFGRFTSDRPIAEQIDLPPTLLSRFDVIYSIQDRPDAERDRLLANRILASHQEGEAQNTPVLVEMPAATGNVPFPPDFLRKYISWARRNIRPVLTDESLGILEDFYVRVRKGGEEPNSPVPITARQLEALVRLSEASARARLSMKVEAVDADRATRIVEGFLKRVATAEGKLDIDTVVTGMSRSQRERAEAIMEIMRGLQERSETFSLEEVKQAAERREIPPARVEALFQTYRNQGEVLEVRPGHWQLVRF